jgi:hypothetical protein
MVVIKVNLLPLLIKIIIMLSIVNYIINNKYPRIAFNASVIFANNAPFMVFSSVKLRKT